MEGTLRSDDVRNEQFRSTKYSVGYDQQEVDQFLDRVVDTLSHYEAGATPAAELGASHVSASKIAEVQFAPTRYRQGYDPQDVDQFLDRLAVAFQRYEAEHTRP